MSKLAALLLVVSVLVSTTVSMPLPQIARNQYLSSSELVKMCFEEGYTYKLILCFLAGVHGIIISLSGGVFSSDADSRDTFR